MCSAGMIVELYYSQRDLEGITLEKAALKEWITPVYIYVGGSFIKYLYSQWYESLITSCLDFLPYQVVFSKVQ